MSHPTEPSFVLTPAARGAASSRLARAGWCALGALGAALVGTFLPTAGALQAGGANPPPQSQAPILSSGGASADSNNRMIAVTGLDLTGQSVLYLVDTQAMQIACYQATGGTSGTQGVRLVGARRIELDMMLDGFNDRTEDARGNPLPFKTLLKQFQDNGLVQDNR